MQYHKKLKNLLNEIEFKIWMKNIASSDDHSTGFMMTIMFRSGSEYTPISGISGMRSINAKFKESYIKLIKQQFSSRRFYKKKNLQPLAFSFIDVAGSKFSTKGSEHLGDNTHIHAIFFPHVSQLHNWDTADKLNSIARMFDTKPTDHSTVLTQIEDDEIGKASSYSAKYFLANQNNARYADELFKIYPEAVD